MQRVVRALLGSGASLADAEGLSSVDALAIPGCGRYALQITGGSHVDWAHKLARLVEFYCTPQATEEPFYLWLVERPVPFTWPSALPRCPSLERFYSLCGGGEFGPMLRFHPAARLEEETASWIATLRNYDEHGDVLCHGRHVVFALDSDGSPWVLDAKTGEVASYWWKGGRWEDPRFRSHDAFMDHLFAPTAHDDDWAAALAIVFGQEP